MYISIYISSIENMYFLAMFNNSVVNPFIAVNNALSHLGRGILSYLCPLAWGILSEGDFVQGILSGGLCLGDFVPLPEILAIAISFSATNSPLP